MNINIEWVNCFNMCRVINKNFKKDLNGVHCLVIARDTKNWTALLKTAFLDENLFDEVQKCLIEL